MSINILTESQMRNLKIQFLFVTANKFEEAEIKNRLLPLDSQSATIFVSSSLTYTIGYLGSYLIAHIHCPEQGSLKPFSATMSINEAIDAVNPICVFMVGVAFGRSEETQSIGDVLISQNIQPYNSVRRSTTADQGLKTVNRNASSSPGSIIFHYATKFADIVNNFPLKYKVHTGTILSGEELIDNKSYKENLILAFSSADISVVGGEMEATGLLANMVHRDNSNWLVVKAICDWGDGHKKDDKAARQELAARNAVDFCVRFFKTDSPSKLPNFKKTSKNYNPNNNLLLINGYKMFYARNKKCCSIKALSRQTKITEGELRALEEFNIVDGVPAFLMLPQKKARKIQSALKCGNELFEDTYSLRETHFFGNKGAHNLCPPECAKAVVFDFDGTLTRKDSRSSSWLMLWDYLGYDLKICEALHRKYSNGDINHQEWCKITAEYFIKKGLSKDDIIKVAQKITLLPGAREMLDTLKKHNIPLYLCSGSIDSIIESVLGDLIYYFEQIASNQFAYDMTGAKLKSISGTEFDFEGKATFIKNVALNLKIETQDIVFVGNSNNDEFAINSGAKTLVVNPRLTSGYDRKIWTYYAGTAVADLRDLLPYLLPDYYLLG